MIALSKINLPALIACAMTLIGGCAAPGLHARMSDDQVRSVLAANFTPAMTEEDVQSKLDGLGVGRGYRFEYPAAEGPGGTARPHVLLVRMFNDGGFFLENEDYVVEWLDVSFVFEPPNSLSRTAIFRDKLRYFQREPIDAPSRPTLRPLRPYPAPIPPPADPLENAT